MGRWPGPRASIDPDGIPVKIAVEAEKCQGHARCYSLAPDLFEIDDYGQSSVVGDGTVPPGAKRAPGWRSPTAPRAPSLKLPIDDQGGPVVRQPGPLGG